VRIRFLVVLSMALICIAGCTAPASTSNAPAEATKSVEPSRVPTATAEVAWFWSSPEKDFPLFRAVATISNPGEKALEGVQIEWIAYDADDSIVGSYKGTEPVIPARSSIPYVAGAGAANLSGVPARVDMRVSDPGRFTESAPTTFAVSEVELDREGKNSYTVKAKVRTGDEEVSSETVFADAVLRNAEGKIVGGDWWFSEGLPETLPPNTSFKVEFVLVSTTEKAESADVFVTERPVQ